MGLSLDHLGPEAPIHMSFDIDSLDPKWASSTDFPVDHGIFLDEGIHVELRQGTETIG